MRQNVLIHLPYAHGSLKSTTNSGINVDVAGSLCRILGAEMPLCFPTHLFADKAVLLRRRHRRSAEHAISLAEAVDPANGATARLLAQVAVPAAKDVAVLHGLLRTRTGLGS
eukprot:6211858-Pleurochrysis_carterae.AAC.3